jgi:NADP-dependent 3-hydroxy acid dehydrogenase YdfG
MSQPSGENQPLKGQVALITGVTAGIGAAVANAFLDAGADLVAVARRDDRLQALTKRAEELGRRCWVVTGDVREESTAQNAVNAAVRNFGQLDILVNNAGVGIYKHIEDYSADDYDTMMDTNMRGTFLFTRYAVPVMLQQAAGTIVNVSSMAGVMGFPNETVYCASKFAQVGFTQALDRELRPKGIKVGVVCPGGVKTEFAIGTGRTEEGVAESHMLEAEDVVRSVMLMVTQPPHSRIIEIRMRPMVEPLAGRDLD